MIRQTFHMQDPSDPGTVYLLESIVSALDGAVLWEGVYAFASMQAVRLLTNEEKVAAFLRKERAVFIIGIDAVTDNAALTALHEIEEQHSGLTVRVYWNRGSGLFHPKVSRFSYGDGRKRLIIGSGNLTPGGLRSNIEAFLDVVWEATDDPQVDEFERFLHVHDADLKPVDEDAIERGKNNRIPRAQVRQGQRPRPAVAEEADIVATTEISTSDKVLVAQVPRAGGRWSQVHYNRDIITTFFQVEPNSGQRVFLTHVDPTGEPGDLEARPCVYSQRNKNYKIELGAASGKDYPQKSPPVVVMRETHARTFSYVLLFPGDEGYGEMIRLTKELPNIGRGVPRVVTSTQVIRRAWDDCPLL